MPRAARLSLRPLVRPLVLALTAALLLGLSGRVAVRLLGEVPHGAKLDAIGSAVVALGAPWLAVAWVVGALAGSRLAGAAAGGLALALGTGAWYALTVAVHGRGALDYAVVMTVGWAAAGLVGGGLFGYAGAVWRSGGSVARATGAAVLAGALAGEAWLLAGQWSGRAAALVLLAELAASGLLLLLTSRGRRPLVLPLATVLAVVAAVGFAVAEAVARETFRLAGWGGA